MSTLKADVLEDLSTGDQVDMAYVFGGTAKLFAELNEQTPALGESLNVSSTDDNGVGDFDFNFTNAMNSSDYSIPGGIWRADSGTVNINYGYDAPSTTDIRTLAETSAGTNTDMASISITIFGALA